MPPPPEPRGGPVALAGRAGARCNFLVFADAVDQAGGIKKRTHLVDDLLDVERDFYCLRDIARRGTGLGSLGDAGGAVQPLAHLADVKLERRLDDLGIHGGSFRHHTRSVTPRSPVEREQSYGFFQGMWAVSITQIGHF